MGPLCLKQQLSFTWLGPISFLGGVADALGLGPLHCQLQLLMVLLGPITFLGSTVHAPGWAHYIYSSSF
jgi:hypothetical protein